MTAEPLKGTITRKLISSDRMMIAHVYFKKGDDVPLHKHESEQLTYILSGALKCWFGTVGEDEIIVCVGEVVVIPSNVPHRALALAIRHFIRILSRRRIIAIQQDESHDDSDEIFVFGHHDQTVRRRRSE